MIWRQDASGSLINSLTVARFPFCPVLRIQQRCVTCQADRSLPFSSLSFGRFPSPSHLSTSPFTTTKIWPAHLSHSVSSPLVRKSLCGPGTEYSSHPCCSTLQVFSSFVTLSCAVWVSGIYRSSSESPSITVRPLLFDVSTRHAYHVCILSAGFLNINHVQNKLLAT
jgi:hypothetical protein